MARLQECGRTDRQDERSAPAGRPAAPAAARRGAVGMTLERPHPFEERRQGRQRPMFLVLHRCGGRWHSPSHLFKRDGPARPRLDAMRKTLLIAAALVSVGLFVAAGLRDKRRLSAAAGVPRRTCRRALPRRHPRCLAPDSGLSTRPNSVVVMRPLRDTAVVNTHVLDGGELTHARAGCHVPGRLDRDHHRYRLRQTSSCIRTVSQTVPGASRAHRSRPQAHVSGCSRRTRCVVEATTSAASRRGDESRDDLQEGQRAATGGRRRRR